MTLPSLAAHASLAESSRLRAIASRLGGAPIAQTALLLLIGASAAFLTMKVDLGIRVPGHAILRAVFPLSLALALVPRRNAGLVAGAGALGGALMIGGWPSPSGPGALASLTLTGPIMDLGVRWARSGRGVYVGLLLAGFASNLLAFGVRLAAKLSGEVGRRPLSSWWPEAIVTYSLCGAAAGLVGAVVWFRFRDGRESEALSRPPAR
jgi:hypothetical protein